MNHEQRKKVKQPPVQVGDLWAWNDGQEWQEYWIREIDKANRQIMIEPKLDDGWQESPFEYSWEEWWAEEEHWQICKQYKKDKWNEKIEEVIDRHKKSEVPPDEIIVI